MAEKRPEGSQEQKLQKQEWQKYLWLLPLGVCLSGAAFWVVQQESQFPEANAESTATPAPLPSAAVLPTPAQSPSSTAKRPTTGKRQAETPSPTEPTLTPEQQQAQQAAIATLQSSIASVDSLVEMKVAIEVAVPAVTIGVSAESRLLDQTGAELNTLAAGSSYTAQVDSTGILLDGSPLPALIWVEPPTDGLFYLNDRAYRGRLLLVAEAGKLWAVNLVSLKNYLYSVVPSEVSPSWEMQALKAQAVAARSYALTYYFKPVNSLYDMGDDEYFQVYKGIESEADRTREAVDATAGEFVSHRGGVVESLYAASDDIVAEAFQGRGMSQLGALNLAEQGYTYDQILATYYPGTAVGRIAQDTE